MHSCGNAWNSSLKIYARRYLPNVDFAEQSAAHSGAGGLAGGVGKILVRFTPFNMSPRHLRRKLSETKTTY